MIVSIASIMEMTIENSEGGHFKMTNNATAQYNGIILLTGYLQRLFVAETIYRRTNEPYHPERFEQIKSLMDETYSIIPIFEQTKSLNMDKKCNYK